MEILKRKISVPQLLLITALLKSLTHIIFNKYSSYCISNKVLLEECDEEENVGVNWAAITFILKRYEHRLSTATYSPIYLQVRAPRMNTQPAVCTSPDLRKKKVSLVLLFGSIVHSYTVYKQSDMCIYTHILQI
jgi:hypothetical protein